MLTRDDVIRLAREAGFEVGRDAGGEYVAPQYSDSVGTLVRLVMAAYAAGQAAEREALANMCDQASLESKKSHAALMSDWNFGAACATAGASEQAAKLADAIRARGEKGGV